MSSSRTVAVVACLLVALVGVAFGGVTLPQVFVQYTNTYSTTTSPACNLNAATWAANTNNQQFAFNSTYLPNPVYQTQVILPGNDYTYVIWRNSTGVQACYQGKFGWWVPNILQRAVGTPAPTSTPWTLSSTLYRANFLLQTVTLEWTNAKNSGNYWQPIMGTISTRIPGAKSVTTFYTTTYDDTKAPPPSFFATSLGNAKCIDVSPGEMGRVLAAVFSDGPHADHATLLDQDDA